MTIEKHVQDKMLELIASAGRIANALPPAGLVIREGSTRSAAERAAAESWIVQAANIVRVAVPASDNPYRTRIEELANRNKSHISSSVIFIAEILSALVKDLNRGLLNDFGNQIRAEAFDDFLDHAAAYLKDKRKNEAGTIAGVVFEDTIRRIYRNKIGDEKDTSLDFVISELLKKNVITAIKGKQARVAAHVRTKATHAQWSEFELNDVAQTVDLTRRFIADYLGG